jgi:hypothetical protein
MCWTETTAAGLPRRFIFFMNLNQGDRMTNYCKTIKTSLSPDREKLAKEMTNYLCDIQQKAQTITTNGIAVVELLIDAVVYRDMKIIHSLKEQNRQITLTPDKSVSKIIEAVHAALPRRYRHRWFVLCPVGLGRMKPAEFIG